MGDDIEHVFCHCSWSKAIWFKSMLSMRWTKEIVKNSGWFDTILSMGNRKEVEPVTYFSFFLLMAIWEARNSARFEGWKLDIDKTLVHAMNNWKHWVHSINHSSSTNTTTVPNTIEDDIVLSLSAPPPGWKKINYDASFNMQMGKRQVAAVSRDADGIVQGCVMKKIKANSILDAELQAAVNLSIYLENMDVIFEGDNSSAASLLAGQMEPPWDCANIVRYTRNLASILRFPNFVYVPRSCNDLADKLAKQSSLSVSESISYHVGAELVFLFG